MIMDTAEILKRRFPDAEWVLRGGDLEWLSDTPKPTKAELEKLWPVVQAEIEAEVQARLERKQSVIEKLGALGLTPDEVADVFGLEVS